MKKYPTWVCFDCGTKYGKPAGVCTTHLGVCDVCGEESSVTEPRDFGYPGFPGYKKEGFEVKDEDVLILETLSKLKRR